MVLSPLRRAVAALDIIDKGDEDTVLLAVFFLSLSLLVLGGIGLHIHRVHQRVMYGVGRKTARRGDGEKAIDKGKKGKEDKKTRVRGGKEGNDGGGGHRLPPPQVLGASEDEGLRRRRRKMPVSDDDDDDDDGEENTMSLREVMEMTASLNAQDGVREQESQKTVTLRRYPQGIWYEDEV